MRGIRVGRPSPALVISIVALVVALGGTSYAVFNLPKNSVGTKQLKNNAVTASKIKNGSVTAQKINTSGLTVPNATNAANAANAGHATNSDQLGGVAATGYEPAVRWALVKADGTAILAQSGGISIEFHETGGYYLNWGSDVEGHSFAVQISDAGGGVPASGSVVAPCGGTSPRPGEIECGHGANNGTDTFTGINDITGAFADKPFYITEF